MWIKIKNMIQILKDIRDYLKIIVDYIESIKPYQIESIKEQYLQKKKQG
jgi:hypothetical protein